MPQKKYTVPLRKDEGNVLREIMNKGKPGAGKRAQALLLANEGYTDEMIADRVGMHRRGIEGLGQRFVEDGFELCLEGKARGRGGTTYCAGMRTGAGRLRPVDYAVMSGYLGNPGIHRYERGILRNHPQDIKKTERNPWQNREWYIPLEANAEFVACMDECPKQLMRNTNFTAGYAGTACVF